MFIFKKKLTWCFDGDDGDDKGGGGGGGGAPTTLKVGDKEYTADQIAALEASAASGKQLLETAQRYGIDPGQYLQFSDSSLGIVSELSARGMIDGEGNLKLPASRQDAQDPPPGRAATPPSTNTDVARAVEAIGQLNERFTAMEAGLKDLFKGRVFDTVKGVNPAFTDDDVISIAKEASRTKRTVLDIAKERAESLKTRETQLKEKIQKELAEEYGLDFAQLNKLKELRADGGLSPATAVKGKTLSMRGGKDTVSPKKALFDYLGQKSQLR